MRSCSIDDCTRLARAAHGWCWAHYHRWRRYGDPCAGRATFDGEPLRWLTEVALAYEGDECLIWPFAQNGWGYGTVHLDRRERRAHRVICEKAHGPAPTPEHDAAHSCGKGREGCVSKRHLRWATRAENMADCIIHGTATLGERNGSAKLTEDDVRKIRGNPECLTQPELAIRFGVSQQQISEIIARRQWAWLI